MASQLVEGSSSSPPKTNAQLLKEKHEALEKHKPTVEEVMDEAYIQHPPTSSPIPGPDESLGISEEAAGREVADAPPKKATVPNTQSEELFPALGGGSKARAAPAAAPAWSAKKNIPSSGQAANGLSNGMSHTQSASSPFSSRASTPPSGILTPASSSAMNNAHPARKGPMQMAMPGKYTDSITLVPAQMDKGKPIQPYLDKLNKSQGLP